MNAHLLMRERLKRPSALTTDASHEISLRSLQDVAGNPGKPPWFKFVHNRIYGEDSGIVSAVAGIM